MVQYWVITPYDSYYWSVFNHAWEYDLKHGTIAIGWTSIGDISEMNWDELIEAVTEWRPENTSERSIAIDAGILWRFQHDIQIGDRIIARCGRMQMLAIGTVTRTAYFDEKKGKERVGTDDASPYPRFLDVDWDEKFIDFGTITFGMNTLTGPYDEEYFEELIRDFDIPQPVTQDAFRLEKHLEEFIITNMDSIFNNEYELYVDDENRDGQQYPVIGESGKVIGKIDILAKKKDENSLLVIELKRDQTSDETVSQIQRYMAWVKRNIHDDVRGMIICTESDENMELALDFVRNLVDVKYYTVSFTLHDNPPGPSS